MNSAEQALEQERIARKRLEAEIALERAESGSLSSAPSAAPTDTESDADADPSRGSRRQSRFKRGQRPDGALRSSPLADYVMQGFSQVLLQKSALFPDPAWWSFQMSATASQA